MFNYLFDLDLNLTTVLFKLFPHNLFSFRLFRFFSFYDWSILVWGMGFVFVFLNIDRSLRSRFLLVLVITLFIDLVLANYLLKWFVARPRPIDYFLAHFPNLASLWRNSGYALPKGFSFPSSHTALFCSVAAIISFYLFPKGSTPGGLNLLGQVFLGLLVVIVGYSRIFLGVHYLGDCLAGGAIGWGIAKLVLNLFHFPA